MTRDIPRAAPRLADWLALQALPGLGAGRLAPLVQGWTESAEPVWPQGWIAALPVKLAQYLQRWIDDPAASPMAAAVDAALAWEAADARHHLVTPSHPHWPEVLNQLPDPPVVLWAKGNLDALEVPMMAMVGTRRPTREGLDNASAFARGLVERGFCIVSGMALGIDGAAQQAAISAGGRSIGILGCGVDVIYPPRHAGLYRTLLASGGLLLSEHPADTRAHPRFFPRRNRLISGLCQGLLVVEAALKSGSLVSARLALEQDREVFALPGSIHNPQASGCLHLIQRGEAALVRNVDDMLIELGGWHAAALESRAGPSAQSSSLHSDLLDSDLLDGTTGEVPESALLARLGDAPVPIDLLVELTGQSVGDIQLALLELELEGRVAHAAGGWVRRGV